MPLLLPVLPIKIDLEIKIAVFPGSLLPFDLNIAIRSTAFKIGSLEASDSAVASLVI